MWWGGLRGAVGFSLAMVLKEEMWYRYIYHYIYHPFNKAFTRQELYCQQ